MPHCAAGPHSLSHAENQQRGCLLCRSARQARIPGDLRRLHHGHHRDGRLGGRSDGTGVRTDKIPLLSSLTFTLGPYVLAGTLLAGIVDRVPPRRLLASCSLGSAGLTAAMAFPGLPVAVLLTLLIGTGTLGGIATATQGALVRSVVPEASYVPARSLIRIASQVAQVAGNPFGGLLLVAVSPGGAFLVSSATLVTAASLARFGLGRHPVTGTADGTALLRDSLRGVRQVFSHVPLRRLLLLGWLIPMFSVAPEALAAPYIAGRHKLPGAGRMVADRASRRAHRRRPGGRPVPQPAAAAPGGGTRRGCLFRALPGVLRHAADDRSAAAARRGRGQHVRAGP